MFMNKALQRMNMHSDVKKHLGCLKKVQRMPQIQIYARVRPSSRPFEGLRVIAENNTIGINIGDQDDISKRPESRYARAPPSRHTFKFSHVFDQKASQEEVFDHVATHMIDSFLSGYNGTIFAYGQTSTGKTHTIEGSSRRFADRGLIPRTISSVFKEVERRCGLGQDVSVHVSYMEIYQDTGYDLLNPGMRPGALMVTLPKVQITEVLGNEVRVRNLSLHLAASEDVAMSLLFQGSTCRKVAETSMNQCSSRSHSIFTIYLTVKSPCNSVITRSKLNLVDLAGSERVAKTGADGRVLREAKHINLSLHHLEHVIVTLQQLSGRQNSTPRHGSRGGSTPRPSRSPGNSVGKAFLSPASSDDNLHNLALLPAVEKEEKGHVPYRNSMLTMVLKDSLGGNCLTAMIATISAEEGNIWESISTCRFSQRVACISNVPKCNEELDDKVVIKRLKQRVAELEAQVQGFKNGNLQQIVDTSSPQSDGQINMDISLSPSDQKLCHMILHQFFHGKIENPVQAGINSAGKFYECMHVMKKIVLHALDIEKQKKNEGSDYEEEVQRERPIDSSNDSDIRGRGGTKRHRRQHKGKGRRAGSTPYYKREMPFPAQMEGGHFVATPVGSKEITRHLDSGAVYQTDSSDVTSTGGSLSHGGLNKGAPGSDVTSTGGSLSHGGLNRGVPAHPVSERGSLSSSMSRHSSGFGSEGSNAKLEWSEEKAHTPSPTHKVKSKCDDETQDQSRMQCDNSLQGGFGGRGSPMHAWVNPPPTGYESSTSTSIISSTSSREPLGGKAAQTNEKQTVGLRQSKLEKQRLSRNVQLLNLQVLEGQLSNELLEIKDKVSLQLARVRLAAQAGGLDPEQLNSEQIIEQQLRQKQSKLQQKLAKVTHQVKAISSSEVVTPTNSSSLDTKLSGSVGSGQTGSSRRSKREQEKQQIAVEDQIERLRMVEMEKQLELKEMATRQKIQALKQKLLGTSGGAEMRERGISRDQEHRDGYYQQRGSNRRVLVGGDSFSHVASQDPPALNGPLRPSNPYNKGYAALSKNQPATPLFSDTGTPPASASLMTDHMKPRSFADHVIPPPSSGHTSSSFGDRMRPTYGDSVPTTSSFSDNISTPYHMTPSTNHMTPSTNHMTSSTNHMSPSTDHKPPSICTNSSTTALPSSSNGYMTPHSGIGHTSSSSSYATSSPSLSSHMTSKPMLNGHVMTTTPNSHITSSAKGHTTSPLTSPSTPNDNNTPQCGHMTSPSDHMTTTSASTPTSREKLTLPEEVKETQYMSAVQKQRVRVSRIRRCIVAATVIQRAWRARASRLGERTHQ